MEVCGYTPPCGLRIYSLELVMKMAKKTDRGKASKRRADETKLNRARVEKFCQLYASDPECSGTRAAVMAGYAEKCASSQASRLLKRPDIRARVREIRADMVNQLGMSQELMIQRLDDVYRRCKAANPVMKWDAKQKAMIPSGVWQFDSRGALKALELYMKMAGMLSEKTDTDAGAALEIGAGREAGV